MPSAILDPHTFATIRYSRVKRRKWGVKFDADRAIDAYTVPFGELERWKRRQEYSGSAFLRRKHLDFETDTGPEFDDDWFLVLENISDEPIRVDYEVFER